MFQAPELRRLLDAASGQMRTMILLGVNCGLGNADCGMLPLSALDLETGWLDFPRPKTGIARRCPLWPETIAALRDVLANRVPGGETVFLTHQGNPWYRDGKPVSPISREFRKLLVRLEMYRDGLSFYCLRHTFQTIADETGDYLATRKVMGHSDGSISDAYRERFPDERLRQVVEHVRSWLWGTERTVEAQWRCVAD